MTRREILLFATGAPAAASCADMTKGKPDLLPFWKYRAKMFTDRHVPVGDMDVVSKLYCDLWFGRIAPNIAITSQGVFFSIWNGIEPLYRTTPSDSDFADNTIKSVIKAGYYCMRFNSGIMCIDMFCKPNEMYLLRTDDDSAKHNGHLTWDTWEPPKTKLQQIEERLALLEARFEEKIGFFS